MNQTVFILLYQLEITVVMRLYDSIWNILQLLVDDLIAGLFAFWDLLLPYVVSVVALIEEQRLVNMFVVGCIVLEHVWYFISSFVVLGCCVVVVDGVAKFPDVFHIDFPSKDLLSIF